MRISDWSSDLCSSDLDFQEATNDVHVAMAMTARMMALVAADVRAWLDMGIKFQHVGLNVSSADMHGDMLDRLLAEAFKRENVPLKHVIQIGRASCRERVCQYV